MIRVLLAEDHKMVRQATRLYLESMGLEVVGEATTGREAVELTRALLQNPIISECFARHAFRYFSAQADPAVEASFLGLREQLPAEQRDNLFNVLLAYIASDLFVRREAKAE